MRERITSIDYEHPFRPLPVAVLNRAGRWLGRLGLSTNLREPSLLPAARRKAGLESFGDPAFFVRMRVLLAALEAEARLTPLGRWMARQNLVRILVNRLRIEDALERHPEIREYPMEDPVFVVGLQRTGTTVLHRLLASDPDFRFLASWEAINPAPFPGERTGIPIARHRAARLAQRGASYLAPDFYAIHPVEVHGPEEDCLLFDFDFFGTVPEATQRVPRFSSFLEEQDHTAAYEYYRDVLRYLHWQRPGGRWVLKTPQHMENLGALLKVFPRARILQTHRDPVRVLASFCSMMAHVRGLFTDEVDPHEVGRHWYRKAVRMVDRADEIRDRAPDAFLDVAYPDLVADPLKEARRIQTLLGRELTPEAEGRMQAWRNDNPQHKYGRHVYRLEDFGLDPEEVEKRFGAYRERYGIRHEP